MVCVGVGASSPLRGWCSYHGLSVLSHRRSPIRPKQTGCRMVKMTQKRKFSVVVGYLRKWSDKLGRHRMAEREDSEMMTPFCSTYLDFLACHKLGERAPEVENVLYSVPSHDIDTNINALKEAIAYLEWLKIGEVE